ncbi:hypothetical protein HQ571_01265 [Candidatus Kuenenbacteria bacterium]|nr:hypothetical protein [Candidatus Kuenenbacteria bacterium]
MILTTKERLKAKGDFTDFQIEVVMAAKPLEVVESKEHTPMELYNLWKILRHKHPARRALDNAMPNAWRKLDHLKADLETKMNSDEVIDALRIKQFLLWKDGGPEIRSTIEAKMLARKLVNKDTETLKLIRFKADSLELREMADEILTERMCPGRNPFMR